jgi:hypothetical protein
LVHVKHLHDWLDQRIQATFAVGWHWKYGTIVDVEARASRLPPFFGDLLVTGTDQVPAGPGCKVARHGGLQAKELKLPEKSNGEVRRDVLAGLPGLATAGERVG